MYYYHYQKTSFVKIRNKKCLCWLTLIFLSRTFALALTSFLNRSSVSSGAGASCCAVGTHHPSLSGAEQVKVMNLIQVPDKRLLFKATVPLIFRCAYWLRHVVEGSKSPLKLESNCCNFFHFVLPTATEEGLPAL